MATPLIDWNEGHIEAIRRMWANGETATAIAKELGVTKDAILGRVRRMRINRNPKAPYPPASDGPSTKNAAQHPLWELPDSERRLALQARAAAGARRTRMGLNQIEEGVTA